MRLTAKTVVSTIPNQNPKFQEPNSKIQKWSPKLILVLELVLGIWFLGFGNFRERFVAVHQVTFVTEGREVQVPVSDDEYVLDAGVNAGLDLPYMCLQGWCTTCAGRLLSGEVDQSEARRYYPEDKAAGFVLLCSAHARSDLRVVTHQKEEMRRHRQALGLPTPRG